MRFIIPLLTLLLAALSVVGQPGREQERDTSQMPYITLHAGLLVPNPEPIPGADITSLGLPIHLKLTTVAGLMKNPHFGMGLGTGLMMLDRGMVIPAFLDIRGDFLTRDVTPFYYAQGGIGIPVYGVEEATDWWGNPVYENFRAQPGHLVDIGIGLKVKSGDHAATTLSIGFQTMGVSERYEAWGSKFRNEYQFQRISIQGGWVF